MGSTLFVIGTIDMQYFLDSKLELHGFDDDASEDLIAKMLGEGAIPCSARPSLQHRWIDGAWVLDAALFVSVNSASVRAKRDSLIADISWRYDRYHREIRLGLAPHDDLIVLDTYIQALADVTKQAGFPNDVTWPEIPS
jgi:hypothetical protein